MSPRLIKSVVRVYEILQMIGERKSLTMSEISKIMDIPKSSCYELITTLESLGLIEKEHNSNRYQLGLKLFELGTMAQENLELRRVAYPILKRLNQELDETVHLTILEDDEVLYIECFESTKRLRTYSVIGVKAPLFCTAVGKAIMAFLDEKEVLRIIKERGLPRFTNNTIADPKTLMKELENVRINGYAIDNMEHEAGVRCVGAPIRNYKGEVFASISISGPSQRITRSRIPQLARIIIDSANEISRKLGWNKNKASH